MIQITFQLKANKSLINLACICKLVKNKVVDTTVKKTNPSKWQGNSDLLSVTYGYFLNGVLTHFL